MIQSVFGPLLLLVTLPGLIYAGVRDLFENIHQNLVVPHRARNHA